MNKQSYRPLAQEAQEVARPRFSEHEPGPNQTRAAPDRPLSGTEQVQGKLRDLEVAFADAKATIADLESTLAAPVGGGGGAPPATAWQRPTRR
jgi:hypothetical protein